MAASARPGRRPGGACGATRCFLVSSLLALAWLVIAVTWLGIAATTDGPGMLYDEAWLAQQGRAFVAIQAPYAGSPVAHACRSYSTPSSPRSIARRRPTSVFSGASRGDPRCPRTQGGPGTRSPWSPTPSCGLCTWRSL